MIKYSTTIDEIGENAREFLEEDIMIIFGDNAPNELRSYCFLVDHKGIESNIVVGDLFILDGKSYEIIGLGNQVNKNLNELGHITINFNGKIDNSMAGTLYLENKEVVTPKVGSIITIESK